MGATTASEKNEIRASPPDHNERRNTSSELLARVVSSLTERSASLSPSPTILLNQGRLGSLVSICSFLAYRGRLSAKYEISFTIVGSSRTIKTIIVTTAMPVI